LGSNCNKTKEWSQKIALNKKFLSKISNESFVAKMQGKVKPVLKIKLNKKVIFVLIKNT
jgi:hypothetical protein